MLSSGDSLDLALVLGLVVTAFALLVWSCSRTDLWKQLDKSAEAEEWENRNHQQR